MCGGSHRNIASRGGRLFTCSQRDRRTDARLGHSKWRRKERALGEPRILAVDCANQELALDKELKELRAGRFIKTPQPARLSGRELQTRHFQIFAANSTKELLIGNAEQTVVHNTSPRAAATCAACGPAPTKRLKVHSNVPVTPWKPRTACLASHFMTRASL